MPASLAGIDVEGNAVAAALHVILKRVGFRDIGSGISFTNLRASRSETHDAYTPANVDVRISLRKSKLAHSQRGVRTDWNHTLQGLTHVHS